MTVCHYFQKGTCKFEDKCKFEHPKPGGFPNGNRFSALPLNGANSRGNVDTRFQAGAGRSSAQQTRPYTLDGRSIQIDLRSERPQWILSAYGPGRDAPEQLFGGPLREQSFEEMRFRYYEGQASGNLQAAEQQAAMLVEQAELQIKHVLSDIEGAIQFIISKKDQHPNREDVCANSNTILNPGAAQNLIGAQSGLNAPVNPFSASAQTSLQRNSVPAMGMTPAQGGNSAFGQPSALGLQSNSFGGSTAAVGNFTQQTAAPRPNPFGQPSALGPSPFAQSSNSQGQSSFGQPSVPLNPVTKFSVQFPPASQITSNSFDRPSVQSRPASNPFGQPIQPPPNTQSPFEAPSVSAQVDPFGNRPQQGTNPFGSQSQGPQKSNPFDVVGSPALQNHPFGQTSAPSQQSPFGVPTISPGYTGEAPSQGIAAATNGTASHGSYASDATQQHPPISSYSSRDMNGRLNMFKGRPVTFKGSEAGTKNRDGTWEKIWFPDGPPNYSKDTELDDSVYDRNTRVAYEHLRQFGTFDHATVPLLPPKREWCVWDF